MTVALAAFPAFYDANGAPLSGGQIWSFEAGTLDPLPTYTDRSGSVANANPVILDASGRASVWLQSNAPYKLRLETAGGVILSTVDNFYAGADPSQLQQAGIVPSTGGDYTGPVGFNGGATFDGTPAQDAETLDSLGLASTQTANLWTNPVFSVWQRGVTSVADGVYGIDQAIVLAQSGLVNVSQLTAPVTGIASAMRLTQPDASAKRIGFLQIVEARDCMHYRGAQLALAAKVRLSVSGTVRAALVAWTGTADAPTRDAVNTWTSTNYTAGNFFVPNTATVATAAVACDPGAWTDVVVTSTSAGGVVAPDSMNNLYMVFWTESTLAQNATLDASIVRCGRGAEAPLWTPPTTAEDWARCQRYYQVALASYRNTPPVSSMGAFMALSWQQMRVAPTAIPSNGSGYLAANVTSDILLPLRPNGSTWELLLGTANVDSYVLNREWLLSAEL